MQPYIIIGIAVAAVALIVIIAVIAAIGAKKTQYYQLKASFGLLKKYEFSYEEYESISHYFRNTLKEDDNHIDDITWNDLDMDKIFMMINYTHSSVGRDYLYKILRCPVSDKSVLEERERLIEFFEKNPHERTKIMQGFDDMGFTRKISISDHIDRLLSLKPASNASHYLSFLTILASVLYTVLVNPVLGVLFIIGSCAYTIITYYKTKSRIDSFFTCVRQIVAMINAAKNITKLNLPELSEYNKRLSEGINTFRKITNNSWLLVSGKTSGGNLSDMLMEYVRYLCYAK